MTDGHTHPDELIAIGEVARSCGVTVATIRDWERKGVIGAVRTPGRQRRFRRADVEALLNGKASA